MQQLVVKWGYRATVVASGAEAIEAIASAGFDVALIDLEMPGMSGPDTIVRIREAAPTVRVLVVSAHDDRQRVLAAFAAGAHGYLLKADISRDLGTFLQAVRAGHTPLSPSAATVLLAARERQLISAEKFAAIGKMAAAVVHEIANPLSYVSDHMSVCLQSLPDEMPSTTRGGAAFDSGDWVRALRAVSVGVEHITQVVRDVSTFGAGVDDGETTADVADAIELSVRMARHATRNRAVLKMKLPEPGVRAAIAPSRLRQVLINLLVNAAQSIAERGTNAPGTIKVRSRQDQSRVVIEVADSGLGVPPVALQRIFDPFYTSNASPGIGLGLSVCRDIINDAGGTIHVASAVGSGAMFLISLPIAQVVSVVPVAPVVDPSLAERGVVLGVLPIKPSPASRFGYGSGTLFRIDDRSDED